MKLNNVGQHLRHQKLLPTKAINNVLAQGAVRVLVCHRHHHHNGNTHFQQSTTPRQVLPDVGEVVKWNPVDVDVLSEPLNGARQPFEELHSAGRGRHEHKKVKAADNPESAVVPHLLQVNL